MISKKNILFLSLIAFIFILGANKVNAYYDLKEVNSSYCNTYQLGDSFTFNIKGYDYIVEYKTMTLNTGTYTGLWVNDKLISTDSNVYTQPWIIGYYDDNSDNVMFYYSHTYKNTTSFCSLSSKFLVSSMFENYNNDFGFKINNLGFPSSYSSGNYARSNYYTFRNGQYVTGPGTYYFQQSANQNGYTTYWLQNWSGNFVVYGTNQQLYLKDSTNNIDKRISSDFSSPHQSVIVPSDISFTYVPVHDNDSFGNDYIKSGSLATTFDVYDTDNFIYEYTININGLWTEFSSNNQALLFNDNYNVYVRVRDLENNIVLSSTFSISGIEKRPIIEDSNFYDDDNDLLYNKLLKIPISYLYNFNTNSWSGFDLIFLSKSNEDVTSNFYIYVDDFHDQRQFPVNIEFLENREDISDVYNNADNNSIYNNYLLSNSCDELVLPYIKTIYNDNTNYYNILHISGYCAGENYSYYSSEYIYIYYNARLYENMNSLMQDYTRSLFNEDGAFEDTSHRHFLYYFSHSLEYFSKPIKEIFKLIKYFFNGLPVQLRYMIISVFLIGVSLIIFKTLL